MVVTTALPVETMEITAAGEVNQHNSHESVTMNNRFKRQQGLTLVEVMVSLIVGAVILAGVMFTYIGMKGTTRDTLTIGELQETGRLALDIMTADIAQAGFWGTFYESSFTAANTTVPAAPANDCQSGLNNGSFPDGSTVEFRYIFAITSAGGAQLNCIDDTIANSDILQVKRLDGQNVAPGATNAQRFYFLAAQNRAEFSDSPAAVLPRPDATLWPYSHHVYYVQEQTFQDSGANPSYSHFDAQSTNHGRRGEQHLFSQT